MILINNVSKIYPLHKGHRTVIRNVNLKISPSQKIGILGRNGAGKSTLVKLISGAEKPTFGNIIRKMTVSWPLAFSDAFQNNQSGMDCILFIFRLYNLKNLDEIIQFVKDFSELGAYLYDEIETYSSGMRARLSFAISMMVEFDCFLIDEVITVGDERFHHKCFYELFEKRNDRSYVIVSHDINYIKTFCDSAAVLMDGTLYQFENVDDAYEFYTSKRMILSQEDVIAGYRFILGQDPGDDNVIKGHQVTLDCLDALRQHLFFSEEFKIKAMDESFKINHDFPEHTKIISNADIVLGFQLIFGREPSQSELQYAAHSCRTFAELREMLLNTKEFENQMKILI